MHGNAQDIDVSPSLFRLWYLQLIVVVSGLSPEIAHFRTPNDGMDAYAVGSLPQDWYIKGAKYVV